MEGVPAAVLVGAAAVGAVVGGAVGAACARRPGAGLCRADYFTVRILPGEDLAAALEAAVAARRCRACTVVSCVGSVTEATLRMAAGGGGGGERHVTRKCPHEILALSGTLEHAPTEGEPDRVTRHLHIALSDASGGVFGGHVPSRGPSRCLPVYTTAEVTVAACPGIVHAREACALSGWPELVVRRAERAWWPC